MSKLLSYVVFSFTILTISFAFNEEDTVCPVSGEKIKGSKIKAEYKKGSISFCTETCKVDFTKNSKKYATLGNYQLVSTGQYVQTNCPVTGRKLKKKSKNPKIVNINNNEVELCCGGCMKKTSKMAETEKFDFLFSDKALKKGFKVASK